MDSDFVNDIGETVESDQVTRVVKETYYDLINNVLELPEHEEIINLDGVSDVNRPTYLKLPETVKRITSIQYDISTVDDADLKYQDVTYKLPMDFLKLVNARDESASNVVQNSDINAGSILIINDKFPEWYTTFDDLYIVCDSYRSATDSTLQASKTLCLGIKEPTWTNSNTFTPDLDSHLFPLLLEEAKSTCFVNFKQVANAKAEQKARRQIVRVLSNSHRTEEDWYGQQADYGRTPRK